MFFLHKLASPTNDRDIFGKHAEEDEEGSSMKTQLKAMIAATLLASTHAAMADNKELNLMLMNYQEPGGAMTFLKVTTPAQLLRLKHSPQAAEVLLEVTGDHKPPLDWINLKPKLNQVPVVKLNNILIKDGTFLDEVSVNGKSIKLDEYIRSFVTVASQDKSKKKRKKHKKATEQSTEPSPLFMSHISDAAQRVLSQDSAINLDGDSPLLPNTDAATASSSGEGTPKVTPFFANLIEKYSKYSISSRPRPDIEIKNYRHIDGNRQMNANSYDAFFNRIPNITTATGADIKITTYNVKKFNWPQIKSALQNVTNITINGMPVKLDGKFVQDDVFVNNLAKNPLKLSATITEKKISDAYKLLHPDATDPPNS